MNNQIKIEKKQLKNGFSYLCYENFAICAQPMPEDLEAFKKKSWTDILNLRNFKEMEVLDFNPADFCKKIKLNYNHIPILKEGGINKKAIEKIHIFLSQKTARYVIHCAKGPRAVLALISFLVISKTYKIEDIQNLAEAFEFPNNKLIHQMTEILRNFNKSIS